MLKVLELYSGIGGFHFAIQECGLPAEVVGAADINNVANSIYTHNFPSTRIIQRCIESLTVKELDKLSPDLIHMSPPCQPFVRVGKQKDAGDQRTKSFLHLIDIIPQLKKRPKYLFLENVKGFDTSETRTVLLEMLKERGYTCQEFLLSPVQFGVPNSRLRYYLMAKLQPGTFPFEPSEEICEEIPLCAMQFLVHRREVHGEQTSNNAQERGNDSQNKDRGPINETHCDSIKYDRKLSANSVEDNYLSNHIEASFVIPARVCDHAQTDEPAGGKSLCPSFDSIASESKEIEDQSSKENETDESSVHLYKKYHDVCRTVGEYLEAGPVEHLEQFLVPPKFLPRFWVMDIVQPEMRHSCCFTKRYGHHIEGAGSVVQMAHPDNVDLSVYKRDRQYTEELKEVVKSLRLRFFTPREIANLMCFPPNFEFPPDVSTIQCYRVLGNSLNVHVVAVLLRILLEDVLNSPPEAS